jgi:hypothetical protein
MESVLGMTISPAGFYDFLTTKAQVGCLEVLSRLEGHNHESYNVGVHGDAITQEMSSERARDREVLKWVNPFEILKDQQSDKQIKDITRLG